MSECQKFDCYYNICYYNRVLVSGKKNMERLEFSRNFFVLEKIGEFYWDFKEKMENPEDQRIFLLFLHVLIFKIWVDTLYNKNG